MHDRHAATEVRPFRARFELAVAFGEGNEPWVIKFE